MWTDIAEQNAAELGKALKELGQDVVRLAEDIELLGVRGGPGAEAARERVFRFLADARQRHESRFAAAPKAEKAAEETEEQALVQDQER